MNTSEKNNFGSSSSDSQFAKPAVGVFKKVVRCLFLLPVFLLSALPCTIHEQNKRFLM